MPTAQQIEQALQKVRDQKSLIHHLLVGALDWPIPDAVEQLEDISYDWTKDDLRAQELDEKVVGGKVYQLKLTESQAWGIFLLEFKNPEALTSGRGMTGPLRKVVRGLVPSRRHHSGLPTWKRENLLFICTHNYQHYRFAYFKAPIGDTKTAPLAAFGWSPDEPARTACEFNLPELIWPHDTTAPADWVARWASAFDVEKVTKQFYEDYAAAFAKVERAIIEQGDLKSDEEAHLFTQSLFNRLMFLRFIERKGWLDLNGRHDYLGALYEAGPAPRQSLYQSRIRPLFFEGLAGEGSSKPIEIGNVPFLNGGLFEQSSLDKQVKDVPNEALAPVIGREGLFYRYNFTVEESTPLDIEVAVDPEMLGKVFEKLVTGRRESGSYYTPRVVVSFMCREALKGYLSDKTNASAEAISTLVDRHEVRELTETHGKQIIDALDALKAVDPACGSGAYLLGLLQELVALYRLLYSERLVKDARSLYDLKLRIISHNVYGVDIDPFATNIAMLRLWLSLAVEATDPLPLPNLDFKIECGDSLAGPCEVDPSTFQFNQLSARADVLVLLKDKYLLVHGGNKTTARSVIEAEEREIARLLRSLYGTGVIDWRVRFADVLGKHRGFNIVLANPPYVNMVQMEAADSSYRELLRQNFRTAVGGFDLFVPFMERGVELLAPGGMFVFIVPNKLLGAEYAHALRRFLADQTQLRSLTDLSRVPVFNASVYPFVVIARKGEVNANTLVRILTCDARTLDLVQLRVSHDVSMSVAEGQSHLWSPLVDPATASLSQALASKTRLEELAEIVGAATVSEAYEWKEAVIDDGGKLVAKNSERYRPFIVSGNVRRHRHTWAEDNVQYIKQSYHQPVLDTSHAAVSDKRRAQISKKKVIVSGMSKRPTCLWDEVGLAAGKSTVLVIPRRGIEGAFLAGVLNSSTMEGIYRALFGSLSLAGGYLRFGPPQLKVLPMPSASSTQQAEIAAVVRRCMVVDGKARDAILEELDQKVAQLYRG